MTMLTATYDAGHKRIVMFFKDDGSADFSTVGDVTKSEIEAAFLAGGGLLAGWNMTEIA